jgi:hypothetical protein
MVAFLEKMEIGVLQTGMEKLTAKKQGHLNNKAPQ